MRKLPLLILFASLLASVVPFFASAAIDPQLDITIITSSASSTNPSWLKIGDSILFSLMPEHSIPGVTVTGSYNGHALSWVPSGLSYSAIYTVAAGNADQKDTPLQITGAFRTDTLGNVSDPADGSDVGVRIDANKPTVVLSSTNEATTSAPIEVTAVFSETVSGFLASDVQITNGIVEADPQTADGITYTFAVNPTNDGTVDISIPIEAVLDVAGNTNSASDTLSRTFELVLPTVSIASPATTGSYGQAVSLVFATSSATTLVETCTLDGAPLDCGSSQLSGLSAGFHTLVISGTDALGATATATSTFGSSVSDTSLDLVQLSPTSLRPIDASATTTISVGNSSVAIPTGTVITKADGSDLSPADFSAAILGQNDITLASIGTNLLFHGAIQWGIAGQGISFSNPITVSIFVGTINNNETFDIHRSLSPNSDWTTDGLISKSCKVVNGYCTFEITKASYFAATNNAPSGGNTGGGAPVSGGGGGGGVFFAPLVSQNLPTISHNVGGQVLGAQIFNFTKNLKLGSKGNNVIELQKVLIAKSYLSIPTPTGYFGGLTFAAVKKYQAAYRVSPVSGFVGPLTRGQLNKGL